MVTEYGAPGRDRPWLIGAWHLARGACDGAGREVDRGGCRRGDLQGLGAVAFLRSGRRALSGRWSRVIDPTTGKHRRQRLATSTPPPTSSFAAVGAPAPRPPATV